jgi:hypothetical protein
MSTRNPGTTKARRRERPLLERGDQRPLTPQVEPARHIRGTGEEFPTTNRDSARRWLHGQGELAR